MVLHFIVEASTYHTARIIREGKVNNYSELGNCDAPDLIKAIAEWARYMSHPSCFHVDDEGCFHSEQFKEYCGLKSIEVKMAAGEAHWQNGIVEHHIGTFRELLNKLLLEDVLNVPKTNPLWTVSVRPRTAMERIMALHQVNG